MAGLGRRGLDTDASVITPVARGRQRGRRSKMWRKRSIRHRYWDVLKRLRLVPGVATFALVATATRLAQ
jgi:hypothetical protein